VSLDEPLQCLGALALECVVGSGMGAAVLERDEASELGDALADDLRRLLPGVEAVDAGFACALFDPAELLRPGWPLHAAIADLVTAAPGPRGARQLCFGASTGKMPAAALQPDPRLAGGALRLLPFALHGESAAIARLGSQMEARLLDTGMASAQLALDCQAAFGLQLEHARWLSIHDLCAMTAMQYEHAGLADCWRLIEAALLTPHADEWLRAEDEPLARYWRGEVRIAEIAGNASDGDPHALRQSQMRARQLQAILAAHGIRSERVNAVDRESAERALRPSVQ